MVISYGVICGFVISVCDCCSGGDTFYRPVFDFRAKHQNICVACSHFYALPCILKTSKFGVQERVVFRVFYGHLCRPFLPEATSHCDTSEENCVHQAHCRNGALASDSRCLSSNNVIQNIRDISFFCIFSSKYSCIRWIRIGVVQRGEVK
uniref:Secreted protein n=1 Tax=Ixodes ricinus TaxID=34613 RepID=A0A6B0UV60_IXORI